MNFKNPKTLDAATAMMKALLEVNDLNAGCEAAAFVSIVVCQLRAKEAGADFLELLASVNQHVAGVVDDAEVRAWLATLQKTEGTGGAGGAGKPEAPIPEPSEEA